MIKYIITLVGLLLAANSDAQFHTVKQITHLYSITDTIPEAPAENELIGVDATKNSDSISTKNQQWIDRYMSVSYPLAKIEVSSNFGYRRDPFTGKQAMHNGLDLRGTTGDEAYAMMFGEITKVGHDKRSGNFVTIRHGDFTISYCHLTTPLVRKGQLVAAGEPIGLVGSTGRSTGSHLHLTVKHRGKAINPLAILDFIHQTRTEALTALNNISTNADVVH